MVSTQKWMRRLAVASATVVAATAVTVLPAAAHVEVSADKAQAGATEVTLSFTAEAESQTAGVVSLQVALPAGIAPADVTLVSGPPGWALTPTADGYTVAGPAIPAGQDAVYQVKVAALPADVPSIAFKTLQTYADGRVDRWIELADGGAEPEFPAPVLALAPAAAPTSSAAPTSAAEEPSTEPTTEPAAQPAEEEGSATWIWWVAGAVVLIAAIGVTVWLRRRQA